VVHICVPCLPRNRQPDRQRQRQVEAPSFSRKPCLENAPR
jgi:hypothetical protein